VTDPDLAVAVDPGVAPLIVPSLSDVTSAAAVPVADTTAATADTTTTNTNTTSTTDSVPAPPALLP
jgi:hypothetical protein